MLVFYLQRLVQCFQKIGLNVPITTTNGVERHYRMLKENYLKQHGFGGTLTSLLTILIRKFLPDMQNRFIFCYISYYYLGTASI